MKYKKITIEVQSDEDNKRLESYVKLWLKENFWNNQEAKIKIEDIENEKENK